jgi:hypothetical protein
MSGTGASLNDKIDLAPWGYAPGDTMITCSDCTKECSLDDLHFLHRHATKCARHALEARQKAIRMHEGLPADVDDLDTQLALGGLERASKDEFIRRAFVGSIILAAAIVSLVFFH